MHLLLGVDTVSSAYFMVEWDNKEDGDYSCVNIKRILNDNPKEGDHVRVKEASSTYTGTVIKKGIVLKLDIIHL